MAKDKPQTMSISDFNLQKLSTKDLSEHVAASIQVGGNIAVFGRRGTGKMLDLETELPTPNGFVKLVDLKEGDQLFNEKGNICNITKLHPVDNSPESYRMTFNDGTIVNACADHLWLTCNDVSLVPKVRTTREILNSLETNHAIENSVPSYIKDTGTLHKRIVDIQKISPVPMRCITVDSSSHLYLITRSFIATHNTEIAKYEIARAGLHEVYLNLSVLERVDMGGYPNIMAASQQKRFVDFLLPQFYEPMLEGKKEVVALLDEVDKTDVSLWAPLLEFTQFRSINGRKLPQLKSVIMTGNLISEGGSRPSLPLLDRSEKYLVEADATSWLEWAGKSGHIHPSITSYITDHPKDLFGSVDPDDRYADPSPRGWTRASEILFKGEAVNWNSSLLNKKVSGCVGKDAGIKYSNYYEHYQQLLPMIDDIYKGKDVSSKYSVLEPTKKLVACMITCARLATQLDQSKEDPPESVKFVGKFLQKVASETVLVTVRSQIQIERLIKWNLDEHPDWKDILNKISKQIDG